MDRTGGAASFAAHERQLAELLLRACAVGAPCGELATALAEAVLEETGARLALSVLEGGAHSLTRALELAERVLADRDAHAKAGAE